MGSGGGDRGVSRGVRASARGDRPAAGASRLGASVVAAAAQRPQCQSSIAGARGRIPAATHGGPTPVEFSVGGNQSWFWRRPLRKEGLMPTSGQVLATLLTLPLSLGHFQAPAAQRQEILDF